METEKNNQYQRRIPSNGKYIEVLYWKPGEDIIVLTGGKDNQPLAYIKLEKYDGNGKPVFSCRDFEGKPLFEDNTNNLYQLKRGLKEKEAELAAALEQKSQSQEVSAQAASPEKPEVKSEVPVQSNEQKKGKDLKEARRGKAAKEKEQDNEHDLSH